MKKLFFLGACLVALASQPVQAQTTVPQVAIVISYSSGFAGHYVVDKDGKTEIVDFTANNLEKGQRDKAETLRQIVAKLYQEGYVLKAGAGPSELIFVKEK